jgi:glucodextranase-like protein
MTTHTASSRRLATFAAGALILAITGCGATPPGTRTMEPVAAKAIAPVRVSLLSPRGGTKTTADHVTVRGTVSPANAVVLVQGRPATVANGVFVATASVHRGRTRIDVIASARDATPASAAVAVTRPPLRPHLAQRAAAPTPVNVTVVDSGGPTTCGDGLSAGPNTTCAFAANVRAAYEDHGPGTVIAYSPVTLRTYAMSCSSSATVVCMGGDNASVYFAGESSVRVARAYGTTACGNGLAVGPNTTCAFAANVRAAYEDHGPGTVIAYSPVTRMRYAMSCVNRAPVVCTGGNHASVYLP